VLFGDLKSSTEVVCQLLEEKIQTVAAYSDRLRHPIPIYPATQFRFNPPPDSDGLRHPLGALI
jgi:hypothetical protein